ncbi:hypothetical protein C5E07_09890 [Pseudoclavibacter sp. RFBJ3]|uniref:MmcQ/YjbR family DNA-binding protein n=1 Tax=unclassified Pseudoclavibacter TaxID=2615177 RepID=UPI000CE84988|nr:MULTISPECIES: MmcQ/YjbR family DNA-binding protein [unclassified Pseudoclavibacter]MBF4549960.1 MmcQ/YjbR family DNA-binding protein [Pseudoclavibacter sp. VKM Ac-2888]PPF83794.1 hypothetical protein C5C12_08970 [Pseudoclavibacter sp. RFBJ5]PPF92074.1 hypothetical protein C5E07_09890 [Pseudoclavibacter sp. RFBJ3]PPF96937.1 hypothetical protein C5C19_13200 [Pseudoclavibacter sp. RFBH5]PPG03248.1 hypothetical protein C5E06_12690 [Pseudoclavibacter sp. RFBI5]
MSSDDDVRRLALRLPETSERTAYGTPAFYVGTKMFARIHDEPGVLVCWRADLGEREALLQGEPSAFFTTPHYDGHPSVLVRLANVPPPRLGELLQEAWEARATKRILRDAQSSPERD